MRARTIESLPGSHPAAVMETALCCFATVSRWHFNSHICVCMSKLSTVLIPKAKAFSAKASTFRVGVHRIATSTCWSDAISPVTGYSFSSAGMFEASRRTIPAISKSGAAWRASNTYLPILPYPTMAALIFFILLIFLSFIIVFVCKYVTNVEKISEK